MAPIRTTTLDLGRARARWAERHGVPKRSARTVGGDGRLAEVATFGSNPGALGMLAYAPRDLPQGAPLVVVLHGCTQDAATYDRHAGWTALADELGFAVVYPEQRKTNNIANCFNWFQIGDASRGLGELLSIREMVGAAIETHRLDPSKIYVTGLSAGGAMTAALLADYPDVFAAGAIIAGLPCGAASNAHEAFEAMARPRDLRPGALGDAVRAGAPHGGPWPRIAIWHGTADRTVAPENGDRLVEQWADVHGVPLDGYREERHDGRRRRVWSLDGRDVIQFTTVSGMGHGAPLDGRLGERPGPFMLEAGVSSTREIAAFFGLGERKTATARATAPQDAARDQGATAPELRETENARAAARPGPGASDPAARPRLAAKAADGAPERDAPQAERHARRPGGSKPGGVDVSAVITRALRSAGLMK